MKHLLLMLFLVLAFTVNAQETGDTVSKENSIGLIISGSGFNAFRLGGGVYFARLTNTRRYTIGWDTGTLFEYSFNDDVMYNRAYFHITSGNPPALLGASVVLAYDKDGISFGLAPEIGVGLSSYWGLFFRYNLFINSRFNSYEVVFRLNLCKMNFSGNDKKFKVIF